jgi:probable HAF family extracellular repeat protein
MNGKHFLGLLAFLRHALALVAALVGARSACGAVQYSITDLGGSSTFAAFSINNAGQAAGYVLSMPHTAYEYSPPSGLKNLGTLGGGISEAYGINDNGQIVGGSYTAAGGGLSVVDVFLYAPGSGMIDMGPAMGGLQGVGLAINNSTQFTGHIFPAAANGNGHAFIYTPNVGVTDLGTLSGIVTDASDGTAINASGEVAGWSYVNVNGTRHTHAFIYANGTMTDLGTLGGVQNQSQAFAINSLGHVAGVTYNKLNVDVAFLYTPDAGMVGLSGFGFLTHVLGMNDLDQIVGYGDGINGTQDQQRAFIYNPGSGTIGLNALISPSSGWVLEEATAINDSGQIVGFGTNPQGNTDAFLLTPLPEPASGVLLLAAAGTLLRRRQRLTTPSGSR